MSPKHLVLTNKICLNQHLEGATTKLHTRYKIQDILLSFCAYNYTHIRQSIQEHNIHKYTIQTQKLQILHKLNCFAVPDKHIQKHIKLFIQKVYKNIIYTRYKLNHYIMYKLNNFTMSNK